MRHICLTLLIIVAWAAVTDSFLFWRFCHRRNCAWNSWGGWSSCRLHRGSCGSGTQMRHRSIRHHQTCGGHGCSGSRTSTRACTKCCPVNCGWGHWGAWGPCAFKSGCCGEGTQTRKRPFARPPTCGGHRCIGTAVENKPCKKCCPQDCVYGPWSSWGPCNPTSGTCGRGSQVRSRPLRVKASCGGKCPGQPSSSKTCVKPCPVNCKWATWGQWGSCLQDCHGWRRKRFRGVLTPPENGGHICEHSDRSQRTKCSMHC